MTKKDQNTAAFRKLVADWNSLMRTFIRPEDAAARSVLLKYMEQILFGLQEFLKTHVGITQEISLRDLAGQYSNSHIPLTPEKKLDAVITELIEELAPRVVNVASPYFVGHMTAAIPFFMVHLKTIVTALNQNVVKIETSKLASVVEKQVLAKIHRLVYGFDDGFYGAHIQNVGTSLGGVTQDGTLANMTALWVARNRLLAPKDGFRGVEKEGLNAALKAYGLNRCVLLVSRLAHYSLKKAAGVLGIGTENAIAIDVDAKNRMDLNCLKATLAQLRGAAAKTAVLAIVGVAGTTETGTIDPLPEIAEICLQNRIHFHVDAAWGGPTLMSDRYALLLKGIELSDSVIIDGHKQLYMPMSCGLVLFKDPAAMDAIEYHANYIMRPGSVDLGTKSMAGSRAANSLILDYALKIMGKKGYALLIEHGIEVARELAAEIRKRPDFQLVTAPELNILTYRYCPAAMQTAFSKGSRQQQVEINGRLDRINVQIQRLQREAGRSFVSRTTLKVENLGPEGIVVLRCVIMNPMTNLKILMEILDEQEAICQTYGLSGSNSPWTVSGHRHGAGSPVDSPG
jgi:putative pyridoxal-dependent aspartate 1-decarboxylase